MRSMTEIFLVLHDIRSIHNVGSIFRTADGAGVSKIFLTGYTPTPVDRFGRKVSAFSKVSLGAEDSVPWQQRESVADVLQELKREGTHIVALEQSSEAVPLGALLRDARIALIVGNEVEGVSQEILEVADTVMEIPMRGSKESLNVSVATGIALYALTSGD